MGIAQKLEISLESNCQCPCEDKTNPGYESQSQYCSQNGDLSCGICNCFDGFSGEKCECEDSKLYNTEDPDSKCKQGDSDLICNGRGDCFCGLCVCHQSTKGLISGKYCECDDFSCLRNNGLQCSGN